MASAELTEEEYKVLRQLIIFLKYFVLSLYYYTDSIGETPIYSTAITGIFDKPRPD